MKTAMQSKTSVKVSKITEKRPKIIDENVYFDFLDYLDAYVNILNKSVIAEHTISFTGQNKEVEKAVRKWIKTYCEFGKVRYNPKTDQTHIMFKTGR
jgi:hypothetical protein